MFHNPRYYRRTYGAVSGLELLKPFHKYELHDNNHHNVGHDEHFDLIFLSIYGSLFNTSSLTSSSVASALSSTVLHARLYNKDQYLHRPMTAPGTLSTAGTNHSSSSQRTGTSGAHSFRYKLSNASWKVWHHYVRELLPSLRSGDEEVIDGGEDRG
ncbi:hypothetical protein DL765_008033 [Monosporascus sp. GIB2]|nr:hypothetical protein DL765_008033 [Monosporascus sp. GIB2]